MRKEHLKKSKIFKKCFDCRREFETETDDRLFCDECEGKEHKIGTGILKIYDKI